MVFSLAWRTWPLLAGRTAWQSSKAMKSQAKWSFRMRIVQAIKAAVRPAGVVVAFVAFTGAANAQQTSAAAVETAKEIISTTGAMTLFTPLIPGVVEQAKNLFLQQNPGLAKDLNEVATKMRADLAPRFSELTDEVAK